jgi:hypothetical protein
MLMPRPFLFVCNYVGLDYVRVALEKGQMEIIDFFLESSLEKAAPLLLDIAKTGNSSLLKKVLDLGVNADVENAYGQTPLHLATVCESKECIIELLKHGVNKDYLDISVVLCVIESCCFIDSILLFMKLCLVVILRLHRFLWIMVLIIESKMFFMWLDSCFFVFYGMFFVYGKPLFRLPNPKDLLK